MNSDNNYNYKLITEDLITKLIKDTESNEFKWNRICLHKNSNSKIHSMVMCMKNRVESGFHFHEKSQEIITYAFIGYPFRIKIMENINTKKVKTFLIDSHNPIVSLRDCICRSVVNNSNKTITYLEHRSGPYLKEKIIWVN